MLSLSGMRNTARACSGYWLSADTNPREKVVDSNGPAINETGKIRDCSQRPSCKKIVIGCMGRSGCLCAAMFKIYLYPEIFLLDHLVRCLNFESLFDNHHIHRMMNHAHLVVMSFVGGLSKD